MAEQATIEIGGPVDLTPKVTIPKGVSPRDQFIQNERRKAEQRDTAGERDRRSRAKATMHGKSTNVQQLREMQTSYEHIVATLRGCPMEDDKFVYMEANGKSQREVYKYKNLGWELAPEHGANDEFSVILKMDKNTFWSRRNADLRERAEMVGNVSMPTPKDRHMGVAADRTDWREGMTANQLYNELPDESDMTLLEDQ